MRSEMAKFALLAAAFATGASVALGLKAAPSKAFDALDALDADATGLLLA